MTLHPSCVRERSRAFWVFLLLSTLLPVTSTAEINRLNIHRSYPVLEAENKVWIGTPGGLYQYDSESDSYKRFVIPIQSTVQNIKQLYYNDEWLWCVLDSSLAALHIRLNEWLVFNEDSGLPSSVVNGLDFQDDYVWAATDKGATRFDLLIEEWETFNKSPGTPTGSVQNILVDDENVWMVFEKGLSEYNPDYEKWRHYYIETDTTISIQHAFFLTDELWMVCNRGLIRFDTELHTQQYFFQPYLDMNNLLELVIDNEIIWVVSHSGIYYYNLDSGVWREFEGNSYLKDRQLITSYVDQSEIWTLTDEDVLVWNRSEKTWEILDYSSGLSTSRFQAAYVNSGMTFLLNPGNIDYRLSSEDNWKKTSINNNRGSTGNAGLEMLKNMFDDEDGGYIEAGDYRWGLEGSRVSWIYDYEQQYNSDGDAEEPEILSGERLDIKSQLSLGKLRSINGFYNNIDYSETMYGIRYRSRANDLLREINWGDYRLEPGDAPFCETASIFGSNIWLQAGPKTDRFKRSLVTLKAYTGERRSQKTYEHYEGALEEFTVAVADINYARNQFYAIPGISESDVPENIRVYSDDLVSYNNTSNTLTSEIIAGISGDFDLLYETQDYYYYEKASVIHLTGYYNSSATIVVQYTCNGQDFEEVLQYSKSSVSTAKNNIYYLKAQQIIPYTFQITLNDATGQSTPLSQFGMDDDGDGIPDSPWIDYQNGILIFPESLPFPAMVYDKSAPQSYYTINASYQTELSLIQLEHNNLVRGTETVELDGIKAQGGDTYVLDYTNGTLVFVEDGLITPETRIEIEYEYYLSDEYSQIHNVAVNFSPSDNISVQVEWVNFENETDSTSNLLKASVEMRKKAGDFDIKVIPAATYQAEDNKLTAYQLESVISSSRIRFQSKYQNFDEDYQNIYSPMSVVGKVKENLELNTAIDVLKSVRVSGSWNDIRGFSEEDSSSELSDKYGSVSALFHYQSLPGYEVTYSSTETVTDTSSVQKHYIQHKFDYQLPGKLLDKMPIKDLKIEGSFKNGVREGQEIADSDQQQFYQGSFRVNANLSEQFQSSIFYRINDFSDNSGGNSRNNHILTSERLLFNLSHERWKLVQTNLRIENTLDSYDYPVDDGYDLDLDQYTQLNFRLSPGVLWKKLSMLFFEYNINYALYATGNSTDSKSGYIWSAIPRNIGDYNTLQHIRTHYIKNEIRPNPNLYVYSLYEWNNQTTAYDASNLYTNYQRLSEKFDIKLGFNTRISLQYKQYYSDLGNNEITTYYEPSVWIERRWSSSLQNILYAAYRNTEDSENTICDNTHKFDGRYDIIFRKKDYLKMRKLEIQQSFSGGQAKTTGSSSANAYYLGSSTSIDAYPIHSLLCRIQLNLNRTVNLKNSDESYMSTDINIKLSLKL